jgi:putative flippase GtrA
MRYFQGKVIQRLSKLPLIGPILRHRFLKFAIVGFSGTIVNLLVLYSCQSFLFRDVYPIDRRLHPSLSIAIFVSTMSNYLLNRMWTWSDRKNTAKYGFFIQMGQFFMASALSILLQYVFTIMLARFMHYLAANVVSIVIAAILAYLLYDMWTFSKKGYLESLFRKD